MEKAILFLDRNKLVLYTTTKLGSPKLDLAATIIDHLDVINEDELKKTLTNFIESNKISPFKLFVALSSSIIFDKSFEKKPDVDIGEMIVTYLKNIPFEEVGTKIISTPKNTRVIAANADLYGKIVQEFISHGFILDAVVPLTLLDKNIYSGGDLTPPTIQMIFKKYDTFKQYSLTQAQPSEENNLDHENETEKKKKKSSLIFLLPVMIILLGVLVFMVIKSSSAPTTNNTSQIPTKAPEIDLAISPTPIISPSTSTDSAQIQDLTMQILNGSGISKQADLVKKELTAYGFQSVKTGNAPDSSSDKTIIIFTPKVPPQTRDDVIETLKKLFIEVSSQETKTSSYDIIITTGKPAK